MLANAAQEPQQLVQQRQQQQQQQQQLMQTLRPAMVHTAGHAHCKPREVLD